MPRKRKFAMIAIATAAICVVAGFSLYMVVEKEIWLKIRPANLLNNTIDVMINGRNCCHQFIDSHALEKHPSTIGESIKITGTRIDVKVILTPKNVSSEKSFNVLGGNYIVITYLNDAFQIAQQRGWPSEE